ncbi:MAG: 2-oxoacid:acceptor oxidoreductase family protein, partial [Chromatiales bacterium]
MNPAAPGNTGYQSLENVIIRFAGDSGDGVQLTGSLFTQDSAVMGNDISTLPDFPAEIRAPAGTLPGVSSFQLNFSSRDVHTPGDRPQVLVALNPAALHVHLADLVPGGLVILNEDAFTPAGFKKAGIDTDPREDGSLAGFSVHGLPITALTLEAVKPTGLGKKQAERCKNMLTLGVVCWLYDRDCDVIETLIDSRFGAANAELAAANKLALQAGFGYADTIRLMPHRYRVEKASLAPGKY